MVCEKLYGTTLNLGTQEITLNNNEIQIAALPNGNFRISHNKLSYLTKTPLEIDKNCVLQITEIDIKKSFLATIAIKDIQDGRYKIIQNRKNVDIQLG